MIEELIQRTQVINLTGNTTINVNSGSAESLVDNTDIDAVAAVHNNIYRGKDLTSIYSVTDISNKLTNNDLSDLYIGDYITLPYTHASTTTNINFRIAHFNYWKYKGYIDTTNGLKIDNTKPNIYDSITANHILFIPDTALFDAQMNSTNTASSGVRGSALWSTLNTTVYNELNDVTCFNGHIIGHSDYLTNKVDGWVCSDELVGLCSEVMVYGSTVWSMNGYQTGIKNQQLALFRLNSNMINLNRFSWWLGSIVSSTAFTFVGLTGNANNSSASNSLGVRPLFLVA